MLRRVEDYNVKNHFYLTLMKLVRSGYFVGMMSVKVNPKALCTVIPVKAFPKPFPCNVVY